MPSFTTGTTKWLRIIAQGNFFLQQWAREPGVFWNSLYTPDFPLGAVTATDTYELDDEIYRLSKQEGDHVRINHGSGQYTDYDIVRPELLKAYDTGFYVAQIGRSIRFNHVFTASDPQFGKTIEVPAYLKPEPFSNDSDEVVMDDPNWLVYMVAADRVKNDVTRKDLRNDLIAQANDSMEAMRQDNDAQIDVAFTDWNPAPYGIDDSWSR